MSEDVVAVVGSGEHTLIVNLVIIHVIQFVTLIWLSTKVWVLRKRVDWMEDTGYYDKPEKGLK